MICAGTQAVWCIGSPLLRPTCITCAVLLQVVAGQTAALALKRVRRGAVRKGMVLVDIKSSPVACWEFDADIAILTHATTIQPRYQAVIHCEIVRQVCVYEAICLHALSCNACHASSTAATSCNAVWLGFSSVSRLLSTGQPQLCDANPNWRVTVTM